MSQIHPLEHANAYYLQRHPSTLLLQNVPKGQHTECMDVLVIYRGQDLASNLKANVTIGCLSVLLAFLAHLRPIYEQMLI